MSVIQRYLSREILKQIGFVLAAVVFIYILVDFFEKADNFAKSDLPLDRTLTYFLLNVPFIISQISPVSILLAVIIIFNLMNRNNETLALRASGVSFISLLRPVLVIGFIASLLLYIFADIIVPVTTASANRIWLAEVKGKSLVKSKERDIWIKGQRKITHITYYNAATQTAHDVAVSFFDAEFRLIRKIDSPRADFDGVRWQFYDSVEQTYNSSTDSYDSGFRPQLAAQLDFKPDDLKKIAKSPSEMGFHDLLRYIRKVEREGYDATPHWVDLHAKPAYAFTCLLMGIIGAGIALRQNRQRRIFLHVAAGITVAFLYWIFYSFSLSLGYGEMLPPVMAAWAANILFGCLGIFMIMNIEV